LVEERITLRYGVPGYSFLIIILIASWRVVLEELSKIPGISGPLLAGFLTFIWGVPAGFLISQLYFIIFTAFGGYRGRWKLRKHLELLEKYGVPKDKLVCVYDYILHGSQEKGIITYLDRRWNIVHSLKATILALILALPFGFILIPLALEKPLTWPNPAGWILIVITLSFSIIIWFCIKPIESEIDDMQELIVKKNKGRLSKILPKGYLHQPKKNE
jgi:hypothetical protein